MARATGIVILAALPALGASTSGCGPTLDISRGKYEQVLSREVVATRRLADKNDIKFVVAAHRLRLSMSLRPLCEETVREKFQVVERVDHRVRSNWWWVAPLAGLAVASLGVAVLENAHNQPTDGIDAEGNRANLRNDAYGIGSVLLIGGLIGMADVPLVGVRDHVRNRDSRVLSQTDGCGPARPYVGRFVIVRGNRSIDAETDGLGTASLSLDSLAGGDPGEPVSVLLPGAGINRSLDFSSAELVELGIE